MATTEMRPGEPAASTCVHAPRDVLTQKVADEMVLLNTASGMYYGLDPVGTRMFELACTLGDVEEVVRVLAEEYEATEEVLRRDLEALLAQLVDRGLAAVGPAGSDEP